MGGTNVIPPGEVTTNTVSGKRGHTGNAINDNERNVFAKSRSGLNDEGESSGTEDKRRLRENARSKQRQSGQHGIPVKRWGASRAEGEIQSWACPSRQSWRC